MDRDAARPALIALLCILAIATAAATLTDPVTTNPGGGSGLGGDPDSSDVGVTDDGSNDPAGFTPFSSRTGRATISFCLSFLTEPWAILGIVGAFALASERTYRRVGLFGPIAILGALGIPVYLLYSLLTTCSTGEAEPGGIMPEIPESSLPSGGAPGAGGGEGGIAGTGVAASPPALALTLLLGVVLVAAVALFFTQTGDDVSAEPEPEPVDAEPDVAAMGRAAGAAADRIEDEADVTNEVYRAWREMADLLPVDRPRSSTPAEFAAAAVEAGMDRRDVDELTGLFEEVRYGGRAASDERERRAVAALRRIEETYADDESAHDGSADDADSNDGRDASAGGAEDDR